MANLKGLMKDTAIYGLSSIVGRFLNYLLVPLYTHYMLHYLESAEDHLVGNDRVEEYSVLPCPKYNAQQQDYHTVVGNSFSIFGIFVDHALHGTRQETLTMLSAVLECWASEGYRKCTPIIFELNVQLKYSQTQDDADMCEYIRSGMMLDPGRVMENALGGYRIDDQFIRCCEAGTSWSTTVSSIYSSASANLDQFLSELSVDVNG